MNMRLRQRGGTLIAGLLLAAGGGAGGEPARPTGGVVLGGGGALGLAHIGVLRVLEELHVPVDYIGGTSMGSIIAGLYACGLSPDEIQSFLQGLDWNEVMSDATPRRELFFRRKREDQRYLFEMGLNWRGPKMGAGLAAGQKFNNLLEYITLRAAAVTNFDQLPIPYRAVATDLQAGAARVLDHGHLATAMRASMAVPGVFTPVVLDGHTLVDGGIVNNLPVDVVKAMGADVIIAVDVGADDDKVNPESLQTLGGILARTYSIAQRPEQMEMFRRADIGIQPALAGMTASQFERVREFVPRGEQAARAHAADLARLAVGAEAYAAFLARQRRPHPAPLAVAAVTVTGAKRVNEAVIRGRIRSQPGAPFDPPTVNQDLLRIYGIGEFEQVRFSLAPGPGETGTLNYDVQEKSWGPLYLKYGLQMRSDFDADSDWAMLVDVTRMSLNARGAEWRNELQLGSRQDVLTELYQPLDAAGLWFVAPNLEYRSELQDLYEGADHVAQYDVDLWQGQLDLGLQLRSHAELRVGPAWGRVNADVETGAADLPAVEEDFSGWSARLVADRQDRTLFAREGWMVDARGLFAGEALGGEADFNRIAVDAKTHLSRGDHTVTLGLQAGSGCGDELPPYVQFTLGGPFGFAGMAQDQFRGSCLGIASLGYRHRLLALPAQLGRGIYAVCRFDAGNTWAEDVDLDDLRYGAAFGLGADTAIGPLYLGYGAADGGYHRAYFSLGTAF